MTYNRILRIIATSFFILLVVLTFFSRTLLDLQVARVSLAFISRETIRPEARAGGIVRLADYEVIFAPHTGRITQILQLGDETDFTNTLLFTISSDVQALETVLENYEHSLRVNSLNIEQTQTNLGNARTRLANLQALPIEQPTAPTLNLWEFELQLEANTTARQQVEEDIITLEILYAEGVIPRQDVINREAEITRLATARDEIYTRMQLAVDAYNIARDNYDNSIAAGQRNRQEQLQVQQNAIAAYEFSITSITLERERLLSRIETVQEQIESGGVVYVHLEEHTNRIVTELSPGIAIGSMVIEGAPIMTTAIRNNNFLIAATFPQMQDFISVGQTVEITVATDTFEGQTTRIVPEGVWNRVYISVSARQLIGGEHANVTVLGASTTQPNVIPLSALRYDSMGYHILFVNSHPRRFGEDYYVYRANVDVGQRDARNVAISTRFELPTSPIIVNSDMPISPGQRVRPVATGSFPSTR